MLPRLVALDAGHVGGGGAGAVGHGVVRAVGRHQRHVRPLLELQPRHRAPAVTSLPPLVLQNSVMSVSQKLGAEF